MALGHSTAVVTSDAPDVVRLGREVIAALDLRGVAKLDFKRDPAGGLQLLEVNPRFSLWNHPGAVAGVNVPAIVFADLTGRERPPAGPARPGVTWSVPLDDLRAAREHGIPLRRWLGWQARCDVWYTVAPDDPLPLVGALLGRARERLDRAGRQA
jgi:predicted ATP-grasp superfamily ATP-dependent carboligase